MALTPSVSKARGSMVPLTGLQLLCCAAVVGVGMHVSVGLTPRSDAAESLRVLSVLDACQRSLASGEPISLESKA